MQTPDDTALRAKCRVLLIMEHAVRRHLRHGMHINAKVVGMGTGLHGPKI